VIQQLLEDVTGEPFPEFMMIKLNLARAPALPMAGETATRIARLGYDLCNARRKTAGSLALSLGVAGGC
jgi:hypothetical protein